MKGAQNEGQSSQQPDVLGFFLFSQFVDSSARCCVFTGSAEHFWCKRRRRKDKRKQQQGKKRKES